MKKQKTKTTTGKSKEKISKGPIKGEIDFPNTDDFKPEISTESEKLETVEEKEGGSISVNQETEYKNTPDTSFSLSRDIFIEVHKSNLLQYFSAGIIFPTKFSSQKAFPDPQAINEDVLLISNGFITNDKNHILICIDVSAINNSLLSVTQEFGLYSSCIPISRIIKLFVHDIETKKKIIDDSIIRDSGFIPDQLIEVGFPLNISRLSIDRLSNNPPNMEPQLKQYDKILGLIAGTRNFNYLTVNQTGKYKSISDHSIFAVQAIDKSFAADIVNSGQIADYYKWLFTNSCPSDRPLLKWLFNRIYDNSNFNDSDTDEFEIVCFKTDSFLGEEKQVKSIFSSLRKSLERKKAMTEILALHSKNSLALYVFAYLRNFGTNQNPELHRLELAKLKVNKFSEFAFATANFFFGYKKLRNSEDRQVISDDDIKNSLQLLSKPVIRFELTTEFDYRIIDSVFNLVFEIKSNRLDKYTNISIEQESPVSPKKGYECYSAVIFGKRYYQVLKSDIEEQLRRLPNEVSIFSEFGLVCHRLGLKKHFVSFENLLDDPKLILKFIHYSKADLIEAIKLKKIDNEELNHRITLSQKYNEL
jgi:hypothetical protein